MSGDLDIVLTCQPGRDGRALVFPYRVQNQDSTPVYVMAALPRVDPASRAVGADAAAAIVLHGPDDNATIGRFIPPPPTDRRMALPVIPFGRLLPPGGVLEGRLRVPLPLAEASPYFPDLPLRQYEVTEVHGVIFAIGYWIAGADGLAAAPCDHTPGLFNVVTRNTARSAHLAAQRFPSRAMELFRRSDSFPRTIAGAAAAPQDGGVLASRLGRGDG